MVDERAAVPPRVVSDDEVCACSFEQWYSTFEAHTWRAEWMRPGETFVRFLLADGVCVGHESDAFPDTMAMGHEDDDGEIAQNDVSDADDEEGVLQSFSDFPEVNSWIRSGIERLGGKVVPKLNWSCPYDATWMMANNSVCCTTADEVMLLLKSSDRACHDLSGDAFDPSVDEDKGEEGQGKACAHEPVLVLKKHFDILPGREFRCFVFNGSLIGKGNLHKLSEHIQFSELSTWRVLLSRFIGLGARGCVAGDSDPMMERQCFVFVFLFLL